MIKASKGQVLNLLMDYPDATYMKIASIVGCSKQWVHQIAKEAGLTRMRRPPHYREDVTVDKVLELYHQDLLVNDIAQTLNCNLSTVRSRLREARISKSECQSRSMRLAWRGNTHYRDDVTVERVLNLYHNDDLPIKEMAKTLGCDQVTVRRRLRDTGISPGECFSRGAAIRWRRKKARMTREGSRGRAVAARVVHNH